MLGHLPGKARGALQWTLLSNLRFGVRQGDDIVIVTLVGLHSGVEDRACVQGRPEAMEPRQAGLGPKDGWVVAPQKLLIHLLVLLLRGAGSARETQWSEGHGSGVTNSAPLTLGKGGAGAQRGRVLPKATQLSCPPSWPLTDQVIAKGGAINDQHHDPHSPLTSFPLYFCSARTQARLVLYH